MPGGVVDDRIGERGTVDFLPTQGRSKIDIHFHAVIRSFFGDISEFILATNIKSRGIARVDVHRRALQIEAIEWAVIDPERLRA